MSFPSLISFVSFAFVGKLHGKGICRNYLMIIILEQRYGVLQKLP